MCTLSRVGPQQLVRRQPLDPAGGPAGKMPDRRTIAPPIAMTARILFVCLGNICRSPTAEGVLRGIAAREYPGLPLFVDSAGTANYHVGEPPDRRTVAAARRRGFDLASLRARQVSRADLEKFDYVLAMDRANLAELARLSPERARAHVGLFLDFAPRCGAAEVPDPYYSGVEEFERVLDLCEEGARGLLQRISDQLRK